MQSILPWESLPRFGAAARFTLSLIQDSGQLPCTNHDLRRGGTSAPDTFTLGNLKEVYFVVRCRRIKKIARKKTKKTPWILAPVGFQCVQQTRVRKDMMISVFFECLTYFGLAIVAPARLKVCLLLR